MVKTLFAEQKKLLDHFFSAIDMAHVEAALALLLDCKGSVVFSGVGKSGHIAEKIAATFASTGTRAFFLSPANALHGDIGRVGADDVCLFFSKGGESAELLQLAEHVHPHRFGKWDVLSLHPALDIAVDALDMQMVVLKLPCIQQVRASVEETSNLP